MSMRKLIIDSYQEAVALSPMPEDLKQSLKVKDRIPALIDNLSNEVKKWPLKYQTRENIKAVVYDYTNIFLNLVKKTADERALSDAAKTAIIQKDDRMKRAKDAVDTGIITEEVLEDV